eukprot:3053121-Heterocapsa_arctica.AAC.1
MKSHHGTGTPYRSAINGVAERRVRYVLEGTRTLLEHSGMPTTYWPVQPTSSVTTSTSRSSM